MRKRRAEAKRISSPPPEESPSEVALAQARQRRAEVERDALRSRLRGATDALAECQAQLDAAMGYTTDLASLAPVVIGEADPSRRRDSVATAVVTLSDWHVGEVVRPEQINGLNAYNPDEAERRAKNCARNAVKLIQKEARGVVLKHVVVALLGDFITGHIHDELKETNAFGPADETQFATRLLAGTLRYLRDETPDDMTIHVVCKSGNHGRITHKQTTATAEANSLEALMYASLAGMFASDRMTFQLSPSTHEYVNIHGVMHRFHHGHKIRYQGGIGTITIPLMKKIAKWNEALPANYDVMGHWHERFMHRSFLINSSLIGMTPYGRFDVAGSSEPPTQSFHLVDSHRGITGHWPIWVLD